MYIKLVNLKVENESEPIGIDVKNPRFSWNIESDIRNKIQESYQILVSSSKSDLEEDASDMWNSDIIRSSSSNNIFYKGKELESCKTYFWKIKIWVKNEKKIFHSLISKFEMGLLKSGEWKGEWLVFPLFHKSEAPIFRKEFNAKRSIEKARIYISGLGYYELSLNGKKIGNNFLDPGVTDYSKRILYSTYDITKILNKGPNVLGVMLGNGWFVSPFSQDKAPWVKPQFILQANIEYDNSSTEEIYSTNYDGWIVSTGPIISNSIYGGEIYDSRLEKKYWNTLKYDWSKNDVWVRPLITESPGGRLVSQNIEPIKILSTLKVQKINKLSNKIFVYDFGQNIAGWVRVKAKGLNNEKIILKYGETLYKNGRINQENLLKARAKDIFIFNGPSVAEYGPRFTYHGFRFVQVELSSERIDIIDIKAKVVASAVEKVGKFRSSNILLNKIYNNIVWTQIDNRHSIPTDCPQRSERLGWMNDATARAEGEIYNFDMSRFYRKWFLDIIDAQGKTTGIIPNTAPYFWGGKPADTVCSSFVIIPWLLYKYYGDVQILNENYGKLKKWVRFLERSAIDNIINYGFIGDWCPPLKECNKNPGIYSAVSTNTPAELISTGYYYYVNYILYKIADLLGFKKDSKRYLKKSIKIAKSFNEKFFDPATSNYASGNQACNIFPLFLGIVPEENEKKLINNILENIKSKNYHLTTGNQCTKYLIEELSKRGFIEIVYKIVNQRTYPSWGYMIDNGATTIWERWELATGVGMNSHNHPMLCPISSWFYKYLGGIDIALNGENQFVIRPNFVQDLSFVETEIKTIYGKVKSFWKKKDKNIDLEIEIPFNCGGTIVIPRNYNDTDFTLIKESNHLIWSNYKKYNYSEEIGVLLDDKFINIKVGSGNYKFQLK